MNKELLKRIEKLENEAKELREQLKEKKKGMWKPGSWEEYFCIGRCGEIMIDENGDCAPDKYRISIGNCYKTAELAERQIEKEKLITEIWDWWYKNDGIELNWENEDIEAYEILYEQEGAWKAVRIYSRSVLSVPLFSSEKLAETCIEHFKDRLDILLTKRWEE